MKRALLYGIAGVAAGLLLWAGIVHAATILFPSGGGTGTGTAPANGKLLIGNSGGTYTVANITPGTGISITNGSGSITIDATGGGGGGSAFPFTPQSWGNATGTTIGFTNGIIVNASSTFPYLGTGGLGVNNGRLYSGATTTAGTGLTYTGNAFNVNTSQNITTLSNLTNGTINSASGVLYNTATSTPAVTAPITYSGTLGQFIGGVSGNFGCTTASAGVTGCLSGTDYNTFAAKESVLTFNFPLSRTANAISSLFSTTSNSGMAAGNLYVGSGGIFQTAASSSIFGFTPASNAVTVTLSGTANQISSSNSGAQALTGNVSTVYSLPAHVIFPGNFQVTNATTTNATTTISQYFPYLATPAGTIVAVDPAGRLIATTTSAGGVTSVTATYPLSSTGGATPNISTVFGTTTNNGMSQGFLYSGSGGIWNTAASSSLFGFTPFNFSYPFPNQLGGGNATSSLTGFSGGIIATASSTVGNGTAGGGLTISGTGTSTGNFIAKCLAASQTQGDNECAGLIYGRQTGTTNSSGIVLLNAAASASARWYIDASGFQRLDNGSSASGLISINGAGTGNVAIGTTNNWAKLGINGGLLANASSTIGDGTQIGGLTISGGATTTGNALFGGTVTVTGLATGCLQSASGLVTSTGLACGSGGGATFGYPFITALNFATTTAATTTSIWLQGGAFFSSSTVASQFPYASSTAITVSGTASTSVLIVSGLTTSKGVTVTGNADFKFSPTSHIDISGAGSNNTAANPDIKWESASVPIAGINNPSGNILQFLSGSSETFRIASPVLTGFGSTSPFAKVSIHANPNDSSILTTLFAIGSSTPTATSTLFSVNNIGSTTLFQIPSSVLKTDANGTIVRAIPGVDYALSATSSSAQFVIYNNDPKSSSPSMYYLYNASSTVVTANANFQTLMAQAVASLGGGGAYSGTSGASGTGPGGKIYIAPGTYYTAATTTINGNDFASTGNGPGIQVIGAAQESTKIIVNNSSTFLAFDHVAIPTVSDMAIYTYNGAHALVATSSAANLRSIWQFNFHNILFAATTTSTAYPLILGNALRGTMYNLEFYRTGGCARFYSEGAFNPGDFTLSRSFCELPTTANLIAFEFGSTTPTGFMNQVHFDTVEGIGTAAGQTFIKSTGLSFSTFNDINSEQFDFFVDGYYNTINNVFNFHYATTRNGAAGTRGCRFWLGSSGNLCSSKGGNFNGSASWAVIDDMNTFTDNPNIIEGYIGQDAGTASASTTANGLTIVRDIRGYGTMDTNLEPDAHSGTFGFWGTLRAQGTIAAVNFASAVYLTVPSGTAPVISHAGDVAYDSTDFQLLVGTTTANTPGVIPLRQKLWTGTVASTSIDFVSGGRIPLPPQTDGVTITEVDCFVDGGTSKVINLDTMAGGSNVFSNTCGTTNTQVTGGTVVTAGTPYVIEFVASSGAPDYVTFSVYGFVTRE